MKKLKPVDVPNDEEFLDRPFFAYGIFKEGQLSHSRIKDCILDIEPDEVHRKMLVKDGIPLIINNETEEKTQGHKIYFKNLRQKEAYEIISKTEPNTIYMWDTISIGSEEFNILVGKNDNGTFEHNDENGKYLDTFDGREDPFFFKVPKFINDELKEIDKSSEDYIFRLQMLYLLLWSAIDRYCSLKYFVSSKQGNYLKELGNDKIYIDALDDIPLRRRGRIHSARDGGDFYFDQKIPGFIVNYFYTIRCNVAHRGKERDNNIEALTDALHDLLDIFNYIIGKTFGDEPI